MNSQKFPKIICITGGIASGKSTIAKHIESQGYKVYNSDLEAKKITESQEVLEEIKQKISHRVFINNQLDRKLLGQLVFENKNLLDTLNQIIHPRVKKDFENWLKKNQAEKIIFKESALVFEIGINQTCEQVISVLAPKSERINRVMKRDNLSKKDILNRMKNQITDKKRRELSDFCIYNKDLSKPLIKTNTILKILEKI